MCLCEGLLFPVTDRLFCFRLWRPLKASVFPFDLRPQRREWPCLPFFPAFRIIKYNDGGPLSSGSSGVCLAVNASVTSVLFADGSHPPPIKPLPFVASNIIKLTEANLNRSSIIILSYCILLSPCISRLPTSPLRLCYPSLEGWGDLSLGSFLRFIPLGFWGPFKRLNSFFNPVLIVAQCGLVKLLKTLFLWWM